MAFANTTRFLELISILEHEKEFSSILLRTGNYLTDTVIHDDDFTLSLFTISKTHDRVTLKYRYKNHRIFGHPEPEGDERSIIDLAGKDQFAAIKKLSFSSALLVPMIIKNTLSGYFLLSSQKSLRDKKWEEFITFSLYLLKNEYHIYNITYLVKKDELTGLFNKRCLLDRLEKLYQKSQNDKKSFSIAVLDIDKFKHYNDTYGHAVGDHILKSVGKTLNDLGKGIGFTPYRYGGEEIVLLFENLNSNETAGKMDLVRLAVMESNFSTDEWFLKLTISVGTADNSKNSSFMEMFEQADKALYNAKNSGRNRVCSF